MAQKREEFIKICQSEESAFHNVNGIGTYKEKRLHTVLKKYTDSDVSHHEIKLMGYVADVFDGKSIFEIQTGSFRPLKEKIEKYLSCNEYDVTVVCPIIAKKYLAWIDGETGETSKKRLSPKRETAYNLLPELYYISDFTENEKFHLRLVYLEAEEYRMLDGWSADKKKGSSRYERIPTDIFDDITLNSRENYSLFLPLGLTEEFTASEFKKVVKLSVRKTYFALNTLIKLGLVEKGEKRGRNYIYKYKKMP